MIVGAGSLCFFGVLSLWIFCSGIRQRPQVGFCKQHFLPSFWDGLCPRLVPAKFRVKRKHFYHFTKPLRWHTLEQNFRLLKSVCLLGQLWRKMNSSFLRDLKLKVNCSFEMGGPGFIVHSLGHLSARLWLFLWNFSECVICNKWSS